MAKGWWAGAVLVVAAIVVWWQGQPAPAFILLATGFVAAVVTPHARPTDLPPDAGTAGLAELVGALSLRGHGIYVPVEGAVRLWVPPEGTFDMPDLRGKRVLLRERPGALGVAVEPPGALLEARLARLQPLPSGGGPQGAVAAIGGAWPLLGIGEDVVGAEEGPRFRLRFRHTAMRKACERSLQWTPWNVQGGCPACSLACMLTARAFGRPIRILDQRLSGDESVIDMEPV